MAGVLLSKRFVATYGQQLEETARRLGLALDIIHLPDDPQARLGPVDLDCIEVANSSRDVRFGALYASFSDALMGAKNLKWAQFHSTAIEQHPFVAPLLARGVKLTTSTGECM